MVRNKQQSEAPRCCLFGVLCSSGAKVESNFFVRFNAVFPLSGFSPRTTPKSQHHRNPLNCLSKPVAFSCIRTNWAAEFTIVRVV